MVDESLYASVETDVSLGDSSEFLYFDLQAGYIGLKPGLVTEMPGGQYTIIINILFTAECTETEEKRQILFKFIVSSDEEK